MIKCVKDLWETKEHRCLQFNHLSSILYFVRCILWTLGYLIVSQCPHMTTYIGVYIVSCNGLLPDCTKPLPKPLLTYHRSRKLQYSHETISQVFINSICSKCLETPFKLLPHLGRANELICNTMSDNHHTYIAVNITFTKRRYFCSCLTNGIVHLAGRLPGWLA